MRSFWRLCLKMSKNRNRGLANMWLAEWLAGNTGQLRRIFTQEAVVWVLDQRHEAAVRSSSDSTIRIGRQLLSAYFITRGRRFKSRPRHLKLGIEISIPAGYNRKAKAPRPWLFAL